VNFLLLSFSHPSVSEAFSLLDGRLNWILASGLLSGAVGRGVFVNLTLWSSYWVPVNFYWVPVNFSCWVPFLAGLPLVVIWAGIGVSLAAMGITWAPGYGGGTHPPEKCTMTPERAFVLAPVQCGFTSAHLVPTAVLSRLPTGHVCFSGANLLHVVVVLKVSALPDPLGEPALQWVQSSLMLSSCMVGCENLQMFLHVFYCFCQFRFRQCSSHCLWGLEHIFPGHSVSMFLQVCGDQSYQQTTSFNPSTLNFDLRFWLQKIL
jgi:hypothetical protein